MDHRTGRTRSHSGTGPAGTARRPAVLARVGLVLVNRAALLATLLALVFIGVELLPGDAARATSERGESAADLAQRRELLGLDKPVLERFWDWMSGLPTGELGTSAHGERSPT